MTKTWNLAGTELWEWGTREQKDKAVGNWEHKKRLCSLQVMWETAEGMGDGTGTSGVAEMSWNRGDGTGCLGTATGTFGTWLESSDAEQEHQEHTRLGTLAASSLDRCGTADRRGTDQEQMVWAGLDWNRWCSLDWSPTDGVVWTLPKCLGTLSSSEKHCLPLTLPGGTIIPCIVYIKNEFLPFPFRVYELNF